MTTSEAVASAGYMIDPSRPLWHGGEGLSASTGIPWDYSGSEIDVDEDAPQKPTTATPATRRVRVHVPAPPKVYAPRTCACGCGRVFTPGRKDCVYATAYCRVRGKGGCRVAANLAYQRAYQRMLKERRKAA